jgi:hypothetical protein
MVVNGWKLPDSFLELCREMGKGAVTNMWRPKPEVAVDREGWPSDLSFAADPVKIQEETDYLAQTFRQGGLRAPPEYATRPRFLKVTDVSKLVWFARQMSGEAFCFDFSEDLLKPRVVYWNDGNWELLAPDFEAFMNLYEPNEFELNEEYEQE